MPISLNRLGRASLVAAAFAVVGLGSLTAAGVAHVREQARRTKCGKNIVQVVTAQNAIALSG